MMIAKKPEKITARASEKEIERWESAGQKSKSIRKPVLVKFRPDLLAKLDAIADHTGEQRVFHIFEAVQLYVENFKLR